MTHGTWDKRLTLLLFDITVQVQSKDSLPTSFLPDAAEEYWPARHFDDKKDFSSSINHLPIRRDKGFMINYEAQIFKYGLSRVKDYMSLHAMPIYGSPALHQKYKELLPLAIFQKGCINFKDEKEMPLNVVKLLIQDCSKIDFAAMKKQWEESKKKKAKAK